MSDGNELHIPFGGPLPTLKNDEKLVRWTSSLCPYCFRVLPAAIVERGNALYIKRTCPEHGEIEELYYSDSEMLKRFEKYDYVGEGPGHAYTEARLPCPLNCGLCPMHKSHTCLLNIVLTNRCDLSCWYCFFYEERAGFVYEPSIEDIRKMVQALKMQPRVVPAIQLTGGEPTLRDDLPEIIKVLKDEGVRHIQLNTTAIKFTHLFLERGSEAIDYAKRIRMLGVNTIYMSFDGVTPQTNPKNHWEAPYSLEIFKLSNMTSVVLVPTMIKSVNDHEVGAILKFAAHNMDVVRGVNIQPVSLVGMMRKQERLKYRITIPDVIKKIEEQTYGQISKEDWYPVGTVYPLARFIEAIDPSKRVEFTAHPACGAATYVYVRKRGEDYEFVPITKFVRVDDLMDYISSRIERVENKPRALIKLMAIPTILNIINKFIVWDKVPDELRSDFKQIFLEIFFKRNYDALGKLHYRLLFVGMMHFMDEWNYDVQRVMRCVIHYALPDGRIVPFCAFNILNKLYREPIFRKYGVPLEEYVKKYGRNKIVKYVRNREIIHKLESGETYRKRYGPVMKMLKK